MCCGSMRANTIMLTFATLAASVVCACEAFQDLAKHSGNSASGAFEVEPSGRLALGGHVRMKVRDKETVGTSVSPILLVVGTPSPPGVVEITERLGDGDLQVEARSVGRTTLPFSAVADKKRREDSYALEVVDLKNIALASACTSSDLVLRGSRIRVHYRFNPEDTLATWGEGLYPVAVEPPSALTLREEDSGLDSFVFDVAPNAPSEIHIRSTLELDPAHLLLRVADPSTLDTLYNAPATGYVGSDDYVSLAPTSHGEVLCGIFEAHVRTKTPDVCVLFDGIRPLKAIDTFDDSITIRFVGRGKCIVTFDVAGLVGITLPTITVEPVPSGSGGSGIGGGGFDFD
ncbi:MAG: hypothetical protein RL385_360 [Pseudomonadota bacterium]